MYSGRPFQNKKHIPWLTSYRRSSGFTIVELLVVIVVIGVLAAITVVSYSNVSAKAMRSKISSDISLLSRAISIARESQSKVLGQITGSYYTGASCITKDSGTDLATLSKSDGCWAVYLSALNNISNYSGINVRNLVDPWGRPYLIDENEGEGGNCYKDSVTAYSMPFVTGWNYNSWTPANNIPNGGYTGCAT